MTKYIAKLNGKTYEVEIERVAAARGARASGQGAPPPPMAAATPPPPPVAAPAAPVAAPAPAPAAPAAAGGTTVNSPMPGVILDIKVAPGQAVTSGQVLVVMEAMKMENDIVSPCDATVQSVSVTKGQNVETDALLVTLG